MVLTVLFCAMLPAGLPQTLAHGSAFNPATTSVALAARQPQRRAVEQRLTPDPGNSRQIGLAKLVALLPAAAPTQPAPTAAFATARIEASTLQARALLAGQRARAPPTA